MEKVLIFISQANIALVGGALKCFAFRFYNSILNKCSFFFCILKVCVAGSYYISQIRSATSSNCLATRPAKGCPALRPWSLFKIKASRDVFWMCVYRIISYDEKS